MDVELAKQQADKPDEDDREMRKKLWLRIGMLDFTFITYMLVAKNRFAGFYFHNLYAVNADLLLLEI